MKSAFPGFPVEGIAFLRDLKKHNDREWFTPRKNIFEETVRMPMIALVRAIHGEMLRFAPEYVGEPARCVFRIYRDTRFSKDKTPYKTHIAAWFRRNGFEKNQGAGFYFSVSPEEIEIAGGLYAPDPPALLAVRQYISDNHEEFRESFASRRLRNLMGDIEGESVTRVPKGFDANHPAIDLLKRKQYVFFGSLDPALAATSGLFGEIVKRFEAMTPFVKLLNHALRVENKARLW
jgi:uncharacterized protein (TIGR02453 family)